jgi:hypothetical protein
MTTLCSLAYSIKNALGDAGKIQDQVARFMEGGGVLGLPAGRDQDVH